MGTSTFPLAKAEKADSTDSIASETCKFFVIVSYSNKRGGAKPDNLLKEDVDATLRVSLDAKEVSMVTVQPEWIQTTMFDIHNRIFEV